MYCAIIHDSSHVTLALFSDVIFVFFLCVCMQYFCAGFTYMRVNFYIFLCVFGAVVVKGRVVLQ